MYLLYFFTFWGGIGSGQDLLDLFRRLISLVSFKSS